MNIETELITGVSVLIGILLFLVLLKRAGINILPKTNDTKQLQPQPDSFHTKMEIDNARMDERLDKHDEELKAGKERFEKMDNRIRQIDKTVGILLDRSGGRPKKGV